MTPPTDMLVAALSYARRGWRVFPIHTVDDEGHCSCGAPDCRDEGKHPRTAHGVKDASSDEATILAWWDRWPNANIGLATGAPSGVDVVDVDPRNSGDATLAALETKHGPLPATVRSITGGGGQHVFFAHDGSLRSRNDKETGIDFKTTGGYVILPPSQHKSGRRYEWTSSQSPSEIAPASHPNWLRDWAQRQRPRTDASAPGSSPSGALILEGERNNALARLAGAMRRHGATPEEIKTALLAVNQGRVRPPLTEEEVTRVAQSVGRYDPAAYVLESSGKVTALLASSRTLHDRVERPTEIPHPLIPDFVWPKTISMLYGPTGVGKTTLVVNLALHALGARGVSNPHAPPAAQMVNMDEGFPYPARPLRVLYIGAEDSLPMFEHLRLTPQMLDYYAIGPEGRGRFQYLLGRVTLAAPRREDVQLEVLIQWVMDRGPFDLIFLDPLTRFHLGFDENDNGQMAQVMAALDALRERTGAAVIFSHHTGKMASRLISGSSEVRSDPTAARGAVVLADQSHIIYSLAPGKGQTLALTCAKSNYAMRPRPLIFERTDGGVLRPIANDSRVLQVRAIVEKLGVDGPVERKRVVEAAAEALRIKNRQARHWVGRAEEVSLVLRVTEDGEPSDDGHFLAVSQ